MDSATVRPSVVWLGDPSATDPTLVGPKAAHLAVLASVASVPEGFCLTVEAHRTAAGTSVVPADLAAAVAEAYGRLVGTGAASAPAASATAVAVRSSAVDEDGGGASFAGQHDTFLNVGSLDDVIAAIGRTWGSLHSEGARAYRRRLGVAGVDDASLAVLVQRMVPADAAGVAFSLDPVTGATDRIVVSASWGLGESVVGGTVTPDAWTLDKATLETLEERLGSKERMTIACDGGTREVAVPTFLRSRRSLEPDELRALATTVRDLEAHLGWPVDVEFAVADGRLHVLQCRPVTAAGPGTVDAGGRGRGAEPTVADADAEGARGAEGGLPPIAWADPTDADRFWQRDLVHFPEPSPVLDGDVMCRVIEEGFRPAIEAYGVDFWLRNRRIWGHYYFSEGTLDLGDDEREARQARQRAVLDPLVDDMPHAWTNRWLPEIEAHLAALGALDLAGASDEVLAAHLDEALRRLARLWEVHFEIVIPSSVARRRFTELHADLFGRDDPLRAQAFLRGFDALTTRAGRAVWRLRPLAQDPEVAAVLRTVPAADVLAALSDVPAAGPLVGAFREVLRLYGARSHALSLAAPTLVEDPAPLVQVLRDALDRPEADPDRTLRDHAEERERLLVEATATLAAYPSVVRREFARRLRAAQAGARLSEDHNFLIDYGSTAAVRRVVLEVGRRLVALGLLGAATDVVHLTADELRATLRDGGPDRRALVAGRVAELERFARLGVPRTIGEAPARTGPAAGATVTSKDAGGAVHTIVGEAASPGVARGRVRVVRAFRDASRLRPGEVLVAPTTSQAWTPLFATAGALVTEAGGMLSHSAVVAREYGLPAVVGAADVLIRLRDGMVVEVDGGRGTVRIVAWQ